MTWYTLYVTASGRLLEHRRTSVTPGVGESVLETDDRMDVSNEWDAQTKQWVTKDALRKLDPITFFRRFTEEEIEGLVESDNKQLNNLAYKLLVALATDSELINLDAQVWSNRLDVAVAEGVLTAQRKDEILLPNSPSPSQIPAPAVER